MTNSGLCDGVCSLTSEARQERRGQMSANPQTVEEEAGFVAIPWDGLRPCSRPDPVWLCRLL